MKSNIVSRMLYILAALIILTNTVFSIINSLRPDISDLPEGKFLTSTTSPGGTSKVNFYIVKNSLGSAIRGEKVKDGEKSNIYWQTNTDKVDTVWVDEYGIYINEIPLNIKTDKFDSRRGTAIFSDGVLAENIAENE
ncbi:MAG: hypothetical protein J5659_06570 [Clostridia bacterium]|nr:hypothetical protein [Clostridia bacterium]